MQLQIKNKLQHIAETYKIRILFACESGSRGWQFPSPDSDYDVRFIYTRPMPEYLSITNVSDHISFPINDDLDIYGWDLRKALTLMLKSNSTPFEWLQSPIVYHEATDFKEQLWKLSQNYFGRRSNIHHYLGIAIGAMDTSKEGVITIKKLFYVLRPVLAAKWCLERETIAPMTIAPLIDLLPPELREMVCDLIRLKAGAAEDFMIYIDPVLSDYIHTEYAAISKESSQLPRDHFNIAPLDDFFKQTIMNHDDPRAEK